MNLKNILFSFVLLGMTSLVATEVATDASAIREQLMNDASISFHPRYTLGNTWQYTKRIAVGALSGIGLGTILALKFRSENVNPQDMTLIAAAGVIVGGAVGFGRCFYQGGQTKNYKQIERALMLATQKIQLSDGLILALNNQIKNLKDDVEKIEKERKDDVEKIEKERDDANRRAEQALNALGQSQALRVGAFGLNTSIIPFVMKTQIVHAQLSLVGFQRTRIATEIALTNLSAQIALLEASEKDVAIFKEQEGQIKTTLESAKEAEERAIEALKLIMEKAKHLLSESELDWEFFKLVS